MYSITQSPYIAADLAHTILDEHLRRASAHRLPKPPSSRTRKKTRGWPSRLWGARPAPAV
jgi:hypothetical protein